MLPINDDLLKELEREAFEHTNTFKKLGCLATLFQSLGSKARKVKPMVSLMRSYSFHGF